MAQANVAQPNLVVVGNALAMLAQEVPLLNNVPMANVQQQLAQLIAGIAAINQQLGDMEQRLNLRMDQQFNDLSQQIGALTTRVQTVETRLDRLPMRLANAAASHDPGRILTGPTGLLPGPTNTKALLQAATGPQLNALQAIVNAPDYAGTVAARRDVLTRFLGVE